MSFIPPMLLDTRAEVFDSPDFIFEPKANGVRLELDNTGKKVVLYTRHATDVTNRLTEIASLQIEHGTMIDGEVVCYYPDDPHKEDFEAVMGRINTTKATNVNAAAKLNPCTLLVFDLLMHKGKSVMNLPLLERKQLLNDVVEDQQHLKKVFHIAGNGIALFDAVKKFELEGIVAKRTTNSFYAAGERPKGLWYKIINWRYIECYITGYRKDKSGWYIAIEQEGKYITIGMIEFGANDQHKTAFYQVAKTIIRSENKNGVWIKPLIRCKVKHRGFLRSGNVMTPVFVEFILE